MISILEKLGKKLNAPPQKKKKNIDYGTEL